MEWIREDGYTVIPLKPQGKYMIDKIIEKDGSIYYDVYDEYEDLKNTFGELKQARQWAKLNMKN